VRAKRLVIAAVLAAAAADPHASVTAARTGAQQPQAPDFRAGVTLVPVDVRVVDRSGKPVADLRQDEFTVLEDGTKQDIQHFALQVFAPGTPAPEAGLVLRKSAVSLQPQTNRIFLIVLGRGRLQEPSKALDALTRFVRDGLVPQDRLAVFAYDRATAFTTDHERIARLLERFKAAHEQMESDISNSQMRGLAAFYGSQAIPPLLQARIDQVFSDTALPGPQGTAAGAAATGQVIEDARRQIGGLVQQQRENAGRQLTFEVGEGRRTVGYITSWSDFDTIRASEFADLSLDEFVDATAQTTEDQGNLYAAIEYLRRFEGEKHIIYLTERGLMLPRLEEDVRLASAASDARVAIDTIETGGLYVGQPGAEPPAGRWNQLFAFRTLRNVSELTGGVSSITEPGTTAFDRLSEITRTSYLLGYYPTNPKWDGTYREITVTVSRPGVSVYYRHGYYGRQDVPAFSRREFITAGRIQGAASASRTIADIRLTLDASLTRAKDGPGYEVNVDLLIDPTKLAFTFVDGAHIGRVTIAVFCFDEGGNITATSTETADLNLKHEVFLKALGSGIPYRVRVPVNPGARRVRAVVYDFVADILGSVDRSLR
jgi:VWFA-related protein